MWKQIQNPSTFGSTLTKTSLFPVHLAVHLQSQYKQYISVHISTSGHPEKRKKSEKKIENKKNSYKKTRM